MCILLSLKFNNLCILLAFIKHGVMCAYYLVYFKLTIIVTRISVDTTC